MPYGLSGRTITLLITRGCQLDEFPRLDRIRLQLHVGHDRRQRYVVETHGRQQAPGEKYQFGKVPA